MNEKLSFYAEHLARTWTYKHVNRAMLKIVRKLFNLYFYRKHADIRVGADNWPSHPTMQTNTVVGASLFSNKL